MRKGERKGRKEKRRERTSRDRRHFCVPSSLVSALSPSLFLFSLLSSAPLSLCVLLPFSGFSCCLSISFILPVSLFINFVSVATSSSLPLAHSPLTLTLSPLSSFSFSLSLERSVECESRNTLIVGSVVLEKRS